MIDGLVAGSVAAVVAAGALAIGIPVMRRVGLMDQPIWRSSHQQAVPRSAGLAILLGIAAGLVAEWWGRGGPVPTPLATVLVAAGALGAVGLVDDIGNLSALSRLAAHVVAGVAVSVSVWHGTDLAGLRIALCAFAFVAFVNAFNFMDGINGISGLHLVVIGGAQAVVGQQLDQPAVTVIGLAVVGGSIGFLPFNFPRARTFMGDVGAYGLSALAAGNAAYAVFAGARLEVVAAPLALYAADTGITLVDRALRGADLRQGHREHGYQRLVAIGRSHTSVALLYAAVSALLAVFALLVVRAAAAPLRVLADVAIVAAAAGVVLWARAVSAGVALPLPPADEC